MNIYSKMNNRTPSLANEDLTEEMTWELNSEG